MTRGISIVKSGVLQPANRETIFCKTLVVGNTVAAYTATLAILQAGEQVCWAQSGQLDITSELSASQIQALISGRFSWQLGRRASSWETATVMSNSQQAYWANWQPPQPASKPKGLLTTQKTTAVAEPAAAREQQLRQAIAPYLENQRLILIPQGMPVRVLYSERRGQRRVYQVVFQDAPTKRRFQIHAKLILDATRNAALQQYLTGVRGQLATTDVTLQAEHLAQGRRVARGVFFPDAIAVVMTPETSGSPRSRPLSIPLRAMIPQATEGFLCVSFPGCDKSLRPIFKQPRASWSLGEAAGHVAARAARVGGVRPLMAAARWPWYLQRYLVQQGIPIFAFDDVALDDPDFEAIQMVAIADVVRTMRGRDLSFRPETPITKAVLASALARLPVTRQLPPPVAEDRSLQDVTPNHWAAEAIQTAIATNKLSPETPETFEPSKVVTKHELWQTVRYLYPGNANAPFPQDNTPARRRHLSRVLYPVVRSRLEK